MWKCVNLSSAAVNSLLQHFERTHSRGRAHTHTCHSLSCGWHFSPFSSANLLVSMVSRNLYIRRSRRSVFRWWETRQLLYAHRNWFSIFTANDLDAAARAGKICIFAIVCNVGCVRFILLLFAVQCVYAFDSEFSIFTSLDDSHNGLNVFIFHRHFEQWHHFGRMFSHWKGINCWIMHAIERKSGDSPRTT